MNVNEKVYTEATPRLIELHKNYKGNKAGNPTNAQMFDNCDNNNDTGCFYAEYSGSTQGYRREGYTHLTEQEFIEFMGLGYDETVDYDSSMLSKPSCEHEAHIKHMLDKSDGTDGLIEGMYKNVNNPSHYTQGSIECLDAIRESMTTEAYKGFLKGQVQKYMWRYEKKANPLEDLKKAEFYLKRLIKEYDNTGV